MALRFSLLLPSNLCQHRKPQSLSFPTTTFITNRARAQIPCTKDSFSDSDLAANLATEVAKKNTQLAQREEAMKKSRELLFTEFCHYLDLEKEEVNCKWSKLDQEEKWVIVKGFVSEWGVNFHPLSARSIKEMIEEYLHEEKPPPPNSSSSVLFRGLRRMMGFSQDK
uniref:Uncharacterized protein MANES_10G092200 n=1 Tax=Rhizophora mucronata TaxID=61149 RepID=A0A2P2QNF1_RHIMU